MAAETGKTPGTLIERIDRRLAATGKSAKGASREAGQSESFIKNIRLGASKSPRADGLQALARVLGTTIDWLTEGRGAETPSSDNGLGAPVTSTVTPVDLGELVPVKIAGKVKAGEFIAIEDLGDWEEPEAFLDTRDPRFPHARHLGFEVEGDSMNALKPRPIQDGDRLSALAYEDIADRYPLRDGMIVVVERTRHGGHEREWSVKQLEIYEDRMEFHPRSTNPRHKPIIIKRDSLADDGVTVEIIAIVRRLVAEFNL